MKIINLSINYKIYLNKFILMLKKLFRMNFKVNWYIRKIMVILGVLIKLIIKITILFLLFKKKIGKIKREMKRILNWS